MCIPVLCEVDGASGEREREREREGGREKCEHGLIRTADNT